MIHSIRIGIIPMIGPVYDRPPMSSSQTLLVNKEPQYTSSDIESGTKNDVFVSCKPSSASFQNMPLCQTDVFTYI